MDNHELQSYLSDNALVRRFYSYETVDSTMSQARRLLVAGGNSQSLHGTLLLADHQSAGRGRYGRVWATPPGSAILASLILARPLLPGDADAVQLSLLASALPVAVCLGVRQLLPTARIKYPNDIVHEGRKLGGVLLEVQGSAIVAGFGVNCRQDLADFPPDLKMPATSIFLETGKTPSRESLVAAIMEHFDNLLSPEHFSSAGDEMHELCDTLGQMVILDLGNGETAQGIAKTISPDGTLILDTPSGPRKIFTSQVIRTWNPN